MAWIKIDHTTLDKPEVMQIAERLSITPEQAFGHLCRVWIWADQQSLNGHAISVTEKWLDRISGHAGFISAMRGVGWIKGKDGAFNFPNFDNHNGETAKKRGLAHNRQVTHRSRIKRDISVTREDKSREEIKTNPPPPSGAFLRFWSSWPAGQRKQAQGKCWTVWQRADLDQQSESILSHVEVLRSSEDWQKGFVPAPLVYLNQRRWEGAEPVRFVTADHKKLCAYCAKPSIGSVGSVWHCAEHSYDAMDRVPVRAA